MTDNRAPEVGFTEPGSLGQASAQASRDIVRPWWTPFRFRAFTFIWAASTAGLMGIAMSDTASAWLMTRLNADPAAVAMVQVATNLPMFLFTLPAGVLADLFDPRRLLIAVEAAIAILALCFAMLVLLGTISPFSLLLITFLVSAAWTMAAPAWLAIVPRLVPKQDLDGATAINGASYNMSRALGPALGGLAIAGFGLSAPFWIFGLANLGSIATLLWWRSPRRRPDSVPIERLSSALRTGIRHVANNPHMRSTLVRTLAFFPFASAYWALMPLLAENQLAAGPQYFGVMLGAIGVGAIGGAFSLNWLKSRLGPDRVVAAGSLVTAGVLLLFGVNRDPIVGVVVCVVAGASWIVVLATLYVSAQVALPDWVRGRGLAAFLTTIFGAATFGSFVWGQIAQAAGLPFALLLATAGAAIAVPLSWRWKTQTGAGVDLSPSMHWRAPHVDHEIGSAQGPVMVTVEYRVAIDHRAAFRKSIEEMGRERKRDGAYAWGIFEDVTDKEIFGKSFLIESWLEFQHLRQRVTKADRFLEDRIRTLLQAQPNVRFMIASSHALQEHGDSAHGQSLQTKA